MDSIRKVKELDILSGIAILLVVLLHSNAYYIWHIYPSVTSNFTIFIENLLCNITAPAVPIFIFISGYKFAINDVNTNLKKFIQKKLNKLLKPFLVLSLIFFIINLISNSEYFNNFRNITIEFINIFRGYNSVYQLWYIPMYIFISITYTLIHKHFNSAIIRVLIIFIIILIQRLLASKYAFLSQHPFDFVYYYIFYEMGLLFFKYNIRNKLHKFLNNSLIIYIIFSIIISFFQLNNNIQLYILSPLYVALYYLLSTKLVTSKLLSILGKYSYYIFLFHEPIICTKISYLFEYYGAYNSIIFVLAITILTIIFSIFIYKIVHKSFLQKIFF